MFKAINSTVDGILSLGELLDMAARLELFLTEEEGSRIFSLMDMDGDEKVWIGMCDVTWLFMSYICASSTMSFTECYLYRIYRLILPSVHLTVYSPCSHQLDNSQLISIFSSQSQFPTPFLLVFSFSLHHADSLFIILLSHFFTHFLPFLIISFYPFLPLFLRFSGNRNWFH